MHQLLLATRNSNKTREFAEILGHGFDLRDLTEERELPPTTETGNSFEANASLKAVEASRHFPGCVVADDSGLEVDALGGAPGIYSARYAGENATDGANMAKLLGELAERNPPHSARFRCCLVLAREGQILGTFEGVIEGTITGASRGSAGFGYDPIFQPLGLEQTFAELSAVDKNRISHRAQAIRLLRKALLSP
jgi:XTP/dITP diphosphohydrolase